MCVCVPWHVIIAFSQYLASRELSGAPENDCFVALKGHFNTVGRGAHGSSLVLDLDWIGAPFKE